MTMLPQGDLRLLETDVAQRLLTSTVPARLAYVSTDGTPRVLPINFHWNGTELVMGTFAPSRKARALRANPQVAITIDTERQPPEVLLVRGPASVTDVDGVLPEYAQAFRRYMGDEVADGYLPHLEQHGVAMERIAVTPTWVGVLDFRTRFPEGMPDWLKS